MEDYIVSRQNRNKIEFIVSCLFTIYVIGTFTTDFVRHTTLFSALCCIAGCIGVWIISMIKIKHYRFRVFTVIGIIEICLYINLLNSRYGRVLLVSSIEMAIIFGLYGIPKAVRSLVIYSTVSFVTVVVNAIETGINSYTAYIDMIVYYWFALLVTYFVYYLVKTQSDVRAKLIEMIDVLEETEQSKDDFLANVSHEIRTPVNTICGMSEKVLRDELEDGVRDDLLSVYGAGRNLMAIVSDILDFSELQSGKMALEEVEYNVATMVNDIINTSLAKIEGKPIELVVDCDATIPCSLIGDEQKIRRVIINLISNAIKFTEAGCVALSVSARKENYGVNLIVSVRDTGIGMDAESMEKIFEKFSQVDPKRTRQEGGLGLGLAISKALVTKMNGFLTLKSELGRGTEVQFVVPQGVADEKPFVEVNNKEEMVIAVYINFEQFKFPQIRDEYMNSVLNMVNQLGVRCQTCRNLAELKRRLSRDSFTHIFTSYQEYEEDPKFFEELSRKTKVLMILERNMKAENYKGEYLFIQKPLYVMPIVRAVNYGKPRKYIEQVAVGEKFIAPDAKILAVDDNAMNLRVVEGLLKPYKIQVDKALSGKEGLKKIKSKEYDFVFMDHMMPEMDGIETLHNIRMMEEPYFAMVPVIALTANAIAGMREMFLEEGFQDFVAKPVEVSVLERVLKRTLPEEKIIYVSEESHNSSKEKEEPVEQLNKQEPVENANEQEDMQEDKLVVGDLDVEKGLTYCGTKEDYIEILNMQYSGAKDNKERITLFYTEQDWKNYAILVHALKSTMLSIGATKLSKLAKELEKAAKQEDADFIKQHHDEMFREYDRVIDVLASHKLVGNQPTSKMQMERVGVEEITSESFDKKITELEAAGMSLDGNAMMEVLLELQKYQYQGCDLLEELKPMEKKIQMFDYMSVIDAVIRLKKRLDK